MLTPVGRPVKVHDTTACDDWCMRRRYTLRVRAEREAATRRRIVEAAVELHRTRGPAETTLSAVADLAGVTRHTLYRHFPTEAVLLQACREHLFATQPPPDFAVVAEIEDLPSRVRHGLTALYRYYAAHAQLIGHVLRDADRVPVGEGFRRLRVDATAALLAGEAPARREPAAAALLAADFAVWRALTEGAGLSLEEAVELMVGFVVATLGATAPRATSGPPVRCRRSAGR